MYLLSYIRWHHLQHLPGDDVCAEMLVFSMFYQFVDTASHVCIYLDAALKQRIEDWKKQKTSHK